MASGVALARRHLSVAGELLRGCSTGLRIRDGSPCEVISPLRGTRTTGRRCSRMRCYGPAAEHGRRRATRRVAMRRIPGRIAAVVTAVTLAACGGDDAGGGPSIVSGEATTTSLEAIASTSTSAPPSTTDSIPVDAGFGRIEVSGQVQGAPVMATSSDFQAFCGELFEGIDQTSVIAHHIRWQGQGIDALESLGLVASDGLATQGMITIRLGVLEDSRFTGDLSRALLDYPSLNNIVRSDELDYNAVFILEQAAHLDLDVVDPGDADTTLRVTADFGCEEEAVQRAQAGPSPGA